MNQETTARKHPKGLWVLFGTEMWERFNFYGMRALLTLFLVNSLMMKEADASLIYGGFLGLCYLTPILGGFISDRFFGNRNCILLGGLMMAAGQLMLFTSASIFATSLSGATTLMWGALFVIMFGNGFFKPNISSMVGSLYPKAEKTKLDSAFTIFYMGINLGALLGQFICPLIGDVHDAGGVRDVHAFKWGFLAASIAMLIGTTIFFFLKDKYIRTPTGRPIGERPSKADSEDYEEGEATKTHFTPQALIIAGLIYLGLFGLFSFLSSGAHSMGEWFAAFSGPDAQNPVKLIVYPLIYSSGLTLAGLIISDKSLTKVETQRIWVIYIVSFFIIFFWAAFEQAGSSLTFIADNQTDRNFLGWDMPPSMVQIFNGIFVVMFAIPFSMLWDYLRARNMEPISPVKQAVGLFLIALSYFIIAHNVKDLGNSGLLAIYWLILLYLIQTFGELCLSPIGLSLVGKLAPRRFASLAYGVFFISNAAGYALSGTLGSILPPTGEKYKVAQEAGVDLDAILTNKKPAEGAELFKLAALNIADIDKAKSQDNNLDIKKKIENINQMKADKTLAEKKKEEFVNKYSATDTAFTPAELDVIRDQKLITVSYPTFMGYTIHNLYEFFMVFVILCGIASVLLFALTPVLKRMMHGVR